MLTPASSYDARPGLSEDTRQKLGHSLCMVIKKLCFMPLVHVEIERSVVALCFTPSETGCAKTSECQKIHFNQEPP